MFLKKKKTGAILAPVSGAVIALEQVLDPVFADKLLGEGAAVIPDSGLVTAPAAGVVTTVADTLHAYGIETEDGLDILVHIGINTVELQGRGYVSMVEAGDTVKAGDPICQVDLDVLAAGNYNPCTPVLITNMDAVTGISVTAGSAKAGETPVITYKLRR